METVAEMYSDGKYRNVVFVLLLMTKIHTEYCAVVKQIQDDDGKNTFSHEIQEGSLTTQIRPDLVG